MRDDRRELALPILAALIAADPERASKRRRELIALAYEWATDIVLYEARQGHSEDAVPLENPRTILTSSVPRDKTRAAIPPCHAGFRNHKWADDDPFVCLRCDAKNSREGVRMIRVRQRKRARASAVA